jgi:hypothetical protein
MFPVFAPVRQGTHTKAVVKMIKVGAPVRLVRIPDGLIRDLPIGDALAITRRLGQATTIQEIDLDGSIWIGFGEMHDTDGEGTYVGNSFIVPEDCLDFL